MVSDRGQTFNLLSVSPQILPPLHMHQLGWRSPARGSVSTPTPQEVGPLQVVCDLTSRGHRRLRVSLESRPDDRKPSAGCVAFAGVDFGLIPSSVAPIPRVK